MEETLDEFNQMPEQYRRDVEDKIATLQAVAEEIHRHLKGICERDTHMILWVSNV